MSNQQSLAGKVAVLTGSSKGIGEAMAYAMGKSGAKIVISSRKQDAVDVVVEKFKKEGIEAIGIACNTGKMEELDHLIQETTKAFGGVDILVNNAATNPIFGNILETDLKAFDKVIDVNLKGPFQLSKLAYASMKQRGGGSIINISSVEGITPSENLGMYSISKAALIMLTKVMANELGRDKIRVNAICPGYIKTKLSEAIWSDKGLLRDVMNKQSLDYLAVPEDIAGLALLLASDAGKFFTGSVITVDGGLTI